MLNIAIIGLGDMGTGHCRGFDKLYPQCEITALCDLNEDLFNFCKNFLVNNQPKYYKNYQDLLADKEIHSVVICPPNYLHKEIALMALEAGKDIFLEKPLAHTIEATDEIILQWGKTDRILQVGLVYRYSNLYRVLGQMVEDGKFGKVLIARCNEHRDNFPSEWFFDENKSGGALLDKDCHHFDLFNWFIKSKPEFVFAIGGQHTLKENHKVKCSYSKDPNLIIKNPTIIDNALVVIEYENEARANLSLCMYQTEPLQGLEINIMGDNGSWAVADRDVALKAGGGSLGEVKEIAVDYWGDNEAVGHIGCQTERKEFLKCLQTRTQPYANLQIGRWSMLPAFAAEKSIKEKRIVAMKEFYNEEVEKIFAEKYPDMFASTPAPATLPQTKIAQKQDNAIASPSFFSLIINLIKSFFIKGEKVELKEFSPQIFCRVADKLNNDENYLKSTKGLNSVVEFSLADKKIIIKIESGKMFINPSGVTPTVFLEFTNEGWEKIFAGENLQKLFFTRKVIAKGNLSQLMPYTEAFLKIGEEIRKT